MRERRDPLQPRPRTESIKRLPQYRISTDAELYPEQPGVDYERPRRRGDCEPGGRLHLRPCPFVSCKYHLYLDVSERNGSIKYNHPHREVSELHPSCALDVAARGENTLDEVGRAINLTRERMRQIEEIALAKLRAIRELESAADPEPVSEVRCPSSIARGDSIVAVSGTRSIPRCNGGRNVG